MAIVTVTQHELVKSNMLSTAAAETSFAASDTVKFPYDGKDPLIRLKATTAGNVVFSAGNGIQGVESLTLALPATKETYIRLDAGFFENVTGENKGFVIMTPAVAGTATVITK